MIGRAGVTAIALAGALCARRAHAEPRSVAAATPAAPAAPDPAVEDAADANLESTQRRRGLTFDAAIGGGLMIGLGIKDSIGRGGSASFRIGHVATRRTVITFELGVTVTLHRQGEGALHSNTNTNLLVGARHYVNTSLWLRGGAGVGGYRAEQVALDDGTVGDHTLIGPAVLVGAGVDIARFKWSVLSIDVSTTAMVSGDGVLLASGLQAGLSFD